MNLNEITYGCEIECMVPSALLSNGTVQVGGYHNGRQITSLPQGWNGQGDGSIRAEAGFSPVEIVSPVLRGVEGLRQVKAVVEQIKAWGGKVNSSCGFHVHIGFRNQTVSDLRRLVHLVANHEKAIYASTGTHSREEGTYCKSVKAGFRNVRFSASLSSLRAGAMIDRYHVLNVSNLIQGRSTVEFRAFAGTLNVTKITGYIRMAVAFAEKATNTNRAMAWDSEVPTERGVGQVELTRLFYSLGWTLGRTDYTYGNLVADDLPSIEANKRMLMKMARKYDGMPVDEEGNRISA
jgi:hypothetical protein